MLDTSDDIWYNIAIRYFNILAIFITIGYGGNCMSNKTKMIFIAIALVIGLSLYVIYLLTDSFALGLVVHTYNRLMILPIGIWLAGRALRDMISKSMKKALVLFGVVYAVDMVIVDAFRYAFSGGTATILFLPAVIPLSFMIFMLFGCKDNNRDKKERNLTLLIGIPLLLILIYIEIISFIH